jgi:hypothetical protein
MCNLESIQHDLLNVEDCCYKAYLDNWGNGMAVRHQNVCWDQGEHVDSETSPLNSYKICGYLSPPILVAKWQSSFLCCGPCKEPAHHQNTELILLLK